MRVIFSLFFASFLLSTTLQAQDQVLKLEDIWNGSFRPETISELSSMKNGKHYSVASYDRVSNSKAIDIFDYQTSQKIKTFFSTDDFNEIKTFSSYKFSDDETKVILETEVESIYRYSKSGKYYVFNSLDNSVQLISEDRIQEPTFSPDGNKVAYVLGNNLYIKELVLNSTQQVTFDGQFNKVINGLTDWVYEEEFKFVRAFEWNADSDRIAFIKFDESNVPEFSMDIYGEKLYPDQQVFKYPKAGEANSKVALYIYDLLKNESEKVYLEKDYDDFYIPRIKWTQDPEILSAQYINRHQNELDLWLFNANGYDSAIILTEKSDTYVDVTDDLTFLDDNSFIWTSEKDGHNHIYYYSTSGNLLNQVTRGTWDVTKFYGYDKKTKKIFYQSVENGSINRDVYSISLNGLNKTRLSKKTGTNNATFSGDFSYFINSYSNTSTPPEYTLNDALTGRVIKTVKDNKALSDKLSFYKLPSKEFSTIKINGFDMNMWMIKPPSFSSKQNYPLLMYQYSGPGSQTVANRWNSYNDYWHHMLAQQGFVVVSIDGRGTGFKGANFKKSTYLNLVKLETEDQIAAAKQLAKLPFIDEEKIGIWGWSFGGHMATNCILKGNDIFDTAIAVAPVTSWRFYDTIYTERYLRTPEENPNGYDENSPFNYPELLKGNFLIVHGSADDNVHVQNTIRMVEALIQADKQFEWIIYPDKNHGIYGGNTRLHLYKKMTNFLNKHLRGQANDIYVNDQESYSPAANTPLTSKVKTAPTKITSATNTTKQEVITETPSKELSKKEIRRNNIKKAKEIRKQKRKQSKIN